MNTTAISLNSSAIEEFCRPNTVGVYVYRGAGDVVTIRRMLKSSRVWKTRTLKANNIRVNLEQQKFHSRSWFRDHSWTRRCSTETILSIQGQETDCARDTSDTEGEPPTDGEYEPVTEPDSDPIDDDTSAGSDNEIIRTQVIEVCVGSEGELVLADSERTDDTHSDSELDYNDYGVCARCGAVNAHPIYRYCHKCFQVRKSLFPPRPRRKHKRERASGPGHKRARSSDSAAALAADTSLPRALSQDSGVETSQGTSQELEPVSQPLKRRAGSLDRPSKRPKHSDASDSDNDVVPLSLSKSVSDPSVSIEKFNVSEKVIADTLKHIETKELCVVCVTEPKSGVFVHGRLAHICCCYRCAVKVWLKTKRCPICKRKISNVLRAVVM